MFKDCVNRNTLLNIDTMKTIIQFINLINLMHEVGVYLTIAIAKKQYVKTLTKHWSSTNRMSSVQILQSLIFNSSGV